MNLKGETFLRKAMRALGVVSPAQLCSGHLFAIVPGAAYIPSIPLLAFDELEGFGSEPEKRKPYAIVDGGVAVIPFVGPLSKYPDIFRLLGCGGRPTMGELGSAVRQAAQDPEVRGLLLVFDSPGGTVPGTHELAEEVAAASRAKPVHGFVQDQAASAAYWIAAQTSRLTLNATGTVGGIGVFSILVDSSQAADRAGLKFHLISTGPHKGAGSPGVPITDDQVAAWQQEVDDVAKVFYEGVARGRKLEIAQVEQLADGRSHVGKASVRLQLADAVGSYDEALAALVEEIRSPSQPAVPAPAIPPPPAASTEPSKEEPMKKTQKGRAPRRGTVVQLLAEALGLRAQEVEAEWEQLTGTVTIEAGSMSIEGNETMFSSELAEGDMVRVADEEHEVATVESDTGATLATAHVSGAMDASIWRLVPQETPEEAMPEDGGDEAISIDRKVAAAVDRRLAPLLVEKDLEALADKVPPAALKEARLLLVRAASEGRLEDYRSTLRMLGATDASALLGGHVAKERQTGNAHVVPGLSQEDLVFLESAGISAEDASRVARRYLKKTV